MDILNKKLGFSIIEVLISLAIFSMIILAVFSFFFSINASNSKTIADREVLENAKNVLETITYEIRQAKSIYTPTSNLTQLSLETSKYLSSDEITTFIDFFLCGTAVCFKKEGQAVIVLTSPVVNVTDLEFTQIVNGSSLSVKVDLGVEYVNPSGNINSSASINLTSSASIRSY